MSRTTLLFFLGILVVGAALARAVNWEYVAALDFTVVWQYRLTLVKGFGQSLFYAGVCAALGITLGTVLGMISQSPLRVLRWTVAGYVEIWRNTPLLVQLIWIHFALPFVTGVNTTPAESAIIGMSMNIGAYFTEIVRAGIEAVPRGQWQAAYALGLPARTRWGRIILPQAFRIMVPPMANMALSAFKATAILSILTVGELMRETVRISNYTFKPVELYTTTAIIYAIVGLIISRLSLRVEARFKRSDR